MNQFCITANIFSHITMRDYETHCNIKTTIFNKFLNGQKTIESRQSIHKVAPYNRVSVGDEILLKETGKDVTATAKVKDVKK